jgi:hypothetical protein
MGDNIEYGVWEGEDEIDLSTKQLDNDDGSDDGDSESAFDAAAVSIAVSSDEKGNDIDEKKLKKRKKFEELKNKVKKRKTESTNEQESSLSKLSAEDACQLLSQKVVLPSGTVAFSVGSGNIFDPSEVKKAPTGKSGATLKCPFVKVIASGIPNFWKCLHPKNYDNEEKGCPKVLVICSGARRAADVIKVMSKELKCKIGKLFAKHFKVEEQVTFLAENYCHVAVGTPNRLSKLVELGALSLSKVRLVMVDMAKNEKKYTVLTMPLVKDDFFVFMSSCVQPELSHLKITLLNENETIKD